MINNELFKKCIEHGVFEFADVTRNEDCTELKSDFSFEIVDEEDLLSLQVNKFIIKVTEESEGKIGFSFDSSIASLRLCEYFSNRLINGRVTDYKFRALDATNFKSICCKVGREIMARFFGEDVKITKEEFKGLH